MTTISTDHRLRVRALYDDLATVYDTLGREELFRLARTLAGKHGVGQRWELAFAVYVLAREHDDRDMAASAVASYAAAALPGNEREGISPESRCAFIAAQTMDYFDSLGEIAEGAELSEDLAGLLLPFPFDAGPIPPVEELLPDE
jgi:hypothetical protein